MAKAATKLQKTKLQKTVAAPDYGNDTSNRLAIILVALSQMEPCERSATFGYLKATYAKEWPHSEY